jgi:hypothetical protein
MLQKPDAACYTPFLQTQHKPALLICILTCCFQLLDLLHDDSHEDSESFQVDLGVMRW